MTFSLFDEPVTPDHSCSHAWERHTDGRCNYPGCPCAPDPSPNYGERFDGSDYVPKLDDARLTGQLGRVYELMKDGQWRTTHQIAAMTGDPQASVLAQLGHLRKERFGSYLVEKQPVGARERGLWEYRVGAKGEGTPVPRGNTIAMLRARVEELETANEALAEENERLREAMTVQP